MKNSKVYGAVSDKRPPIWIVAKLAEDKIDVSESLVWVYCGINR